MNAAGQSGIPRGAGRPRTWAARAHPSAEVAHHFAQRGVFPPTRIASDRPILSSYQSLNVCSYGVSSNNRRIGPLRRLRTIGFLSGLACSATLRSARPRAKQPKPATQPLADLANGSLFRSDLLDDLTSVPTCARTARSPRQAHLAGSLCGSVRPKPASCAVHELQLSRAVDDSATLANGKSPP
jgi:hypothetical protein